MQDNDESYQRLRSSSGGLDREDEALVPRLVPMLVDSMLSQPSARFDPRIRLGAGDNMPCSTSESVFLGDLLPDPDP